MVNTMQSTQNQPSLRLAFILLVGLLSLSAASAWSSYEVYGRGPIPDLWQLILAAGSIVSFAIFWLLRCEVVSRRQSRDLLGQLELAETALRISEARFRRLIELVPEAVLISSCEGHLLFVNPHTLVLFGYEPGELLGGGIEQILPELADFITGPNPFSINPQPVAGVIMRALRKSGERFDCEVSLTPLEAADNTLITIIIRDLKERRRMESLERELHRLRLLQRVA